MYLIHYALISAKLSRKKWVGQGVTFPRFKEPCQVTLCSQLALHW